MQAYKINLKPMGDDGSAPKYQNKPSEVQNEGSTSDFSAQVNFTTVIHGKFTPGGTKATLIVAQFQLLGSHHSRRYSSAEISFHFRDNQQFPTFSVYRIAPSGKYALSPSWDTEESKLGVTAIATAGGQALYERPETSDYQDYGIFCGSVSSRGRADREKNIALWEMNENKTQESGIPVLINVAILLKRNDNNPFFVEIDSTARLNVLDDLENRVQRFFGSSIITFNPEGPVIGDTPEGLDSDNLSEYPLKDLSKVEIAPLMESLTE